MRIFLTRRAKKAYTSIKDYIAKEWSETVAAAFEQKAIDFLDLLEDFPEIGTIEVNDTQIRGFQLTKQTKVFYRVKNDKIIILTFF